MKFHLAKHGGSSSSRSNNSVTHDADRLPTVSAAQVLDELDGDPSRHVSTGLYDLDRALAGTVPSNCSAIHGPGGVVRGQITEIWGPPGAGKTGLG